MLGSLFIVAAPSGAGKTSLVNALVEQQKNIALSISYTTRTARDGEVDGKDYFFLSEKDFLKNIYKVINLKPDWGHAHYHLSRIKKYKKNDPQLAVMHSFLSSTSLSVIDRIGFNFALSHVYEKLEMHDEQFKFLNEANRLRKEETKYFIDKDQQLFSRIKDSFKFPPSAVKKSSCKSSNQFKISHEIISSS